MIIKSRSITQQGHWGTYPRTLEVLLSVSSDPVTTEGAGVLLWAAEVRGNAPSHPTWAVHCSRAISISWCFQMPSEHRALDEKEGHKVMLHYGIYVSKLWGFAFIFPHFFFLKHSWLQKGLLKSFSANKFLSEKHNLLPIHFQDDCISANTCL